MAEEKKEEQEKKCVIYYKKGWVKVWFDQVEARQLKGEKFDRLESCCEVFEGAFLKTGNTKNTSWDISTLFDEKPGLCFLKKGSVLGLFLFGLSVGFCFSCGAKIQLKKSREVMIKDKMKQVKDGYEEKELKEGWGQ